MKHEPFQKTTIKKQEGWWVGPPRRGQFGDETMAFCPRGLRALLDERLDSTRHYELRVYLKKPRTQVREVVIFRRDYNNWYWKIKGFGRFKWIPWSIRHFLTHNFQSIESLNLGQSATLYVRAIPGKKRK